MKKEYDSCFNKWLESYLALASSSQPGGKPVDIDVLKQKGRELDSDCGKQFQAYRDCLQVG